MKKNYALLLGMRLFILFCLTGMQAQTVQTYSYTGSVQTFTVPQCVGTITVDARGGQGANAADVLPNNSSGGLGGRVVGVITVTPGQVLNIYVGGAGNASGAGGYNGGGAGGVASAGSGCNGGSGGGGGGASDIRIGGTALSNRVLVAAGGGGAGRDYCNGSCQPCGCGGSGGGGGGLFGVVGLAANNCNNGYPGSGTNFGAAGTQTAGGTGGPGDNGGTGGSNGTLGNGGAGGGGTYDVAGGGGGGGYYGGGGGGSASSGSGVGGGGGGGGSSYLVGLLSASTTSANNSGNGIIIFSYQIGNIGVPVVAQNPICAGNSVVLSCPSMTTYAWSNSATTPSITVAPTSNATYSVSGITSAGCTAIGVVNLTVSPGVPTLAVTSSTNQTCLGKTATLTATGAMTYTWSNNVTNGVSFTPSVTTTYTVQGQNGCGITTAVTTISIAPLPVTLISSSPTVCAGSTATLTSAAAATSYSWYPVSNSTPSIIVSPNVNTVYTVAVSDGTCFGAATVAVNALPVPTIAITPTLSTVCSGVPVNLTATGGLSYTWTPGNLSGNSVTVSPTSPTGYNVVGSNSLGCTSSAAAAIITNASPTLNVSADNGMVCVGGQVNITVTGANTYTWSTGSNSNAITVNPMSTTIYTIDGSSNGCSTSQTIQISVFIPTMAISGPTAICAGKSATLVASNASTYNWNNGFTTQSILVNPSATSIYSVSALSNSAGINCPSSATLQLVVNPNPTVTAVATRTIICKTESTTINASGATTYSWSSSASTSSIVVTSSLITTLNYTVTGTNSNGCAATATALVKINSCNGLGEIKGLATSLGIFPNPSNGEFTVSFDTDIKLDLVNELGQLIKVLNLTGANDYKVNVSGLSSGVYFLVNKNGTEKIERKIVVNK